MVRKPPQPLRNTLHKFKQFSLLKDLDLSVLMLIVITKSLRLNCFSDFCTQDIPTDPQTPSLELCSVLCIEKVYSRQQRSIQEF